MRRIGGRTGLTTPPPRFWTARERFHQSVAQQEETRREGQGSSESTPPSPPVAVQPAARRALQMDSQEEKAPATPSARDTQPVHHLLGHLQACELTDCVRCITKTRELESQSECGQCIPWRQGWVDEITPGVGICQRVQTTMVQIQDALMDLRGVRAEQEQWEGVRSSELATLLQHNPNHEPNTRPCTACSQMTRTGTREPRCPKCRL